jgi:hypothetical protein
MNAASYSGRERPRAKKSRPTFAERLVIVQTKPRTSMLAASQLRGAPAPQTPQQLRQSTAIVDQRA